MGDHFGWAQAIGRTTGRCHRDRFKEIQERFLSKYNFEAKIKRRTLAFAAFYLYPVVMITEHFGNWINNKPASGH